MFGLAIPKIECIDSSNNYGHFLTQPLEKGFGTTLGNAMRRVLLQYLPGAAVTRVHIEGIQHEFSPIPHVKEDVLELLLNIKALRLKPLSDRPISLTLEKETEGEVHASDINPSTEVEIVNPELYIATLDSPEAKLYMDMDVELGIGYKPAESSDSLPAGTIPVDAIFTPVQKVNFSVEPIHIGQETSREQMHLELWTDGTITPVSAISYAASLLTEQLAPFVDYGRVSQAEEEKKALRASIPKNLFNMPVEQLDLSVRAMNCLRRSGITTVGELVSTGGKELLSLRNFGQKSKQEVEERLRELGLSFSIEEEGTED
ncbi:MAG TPA: DNA-directed RNA polymerase subunit alpha [Dehalococcoidia bacterium]|nr:DNA-directed RNA polymerase subunit alpha [Dehalococcoidia bacterium]